MGSMYNVPRPRRDATHTAVMILHGWQLDLTVKRHNGKKTFLINNTIARGL